MNLNNKGFAITGILYTVFILFLMILLSVISGLNIKRQLLEKNMENIKEKLEEKCEGLTGKKAIGYETQYPGKYTFDINGTTYDTYLPQGKILKAQDLQTLNYINNNPDFSSYDETQMAAIEIVKICTIDITE